MENPSNREAEAPAPSGSERPNPANRGDRSKPFDQNLSPRAALATALTAALGSGDLALARVAHEALGRLLAEPDDATPAPVDLAAERARRGKG